MTDAERYTPPKVWTWDKENGGKWAGLNRPIAGATHDTELPVGKHPFQLYSLATPNGVKVTVMFRGREITLSDRGRALLQQIATELEEIAVVEQYPKFEGRTMMMVLAPK